MFRDLVVTARRRPKLELRFDRGGNDQVIFGTAGGFDAAYVRLRVANGPGKDTADDVVVMVTELRLADSEDTRPIHLPLTWSGTSPPLTVSAVHPGSARHIDLLHVDLQGDDEVEAPIQLDLNPKPTGSQDLLEPGTYEISIEIRARNADALRYVIPISWDGKRSAGAAMWDHLRVEPPRAL